MSRGAAPPTPRSSSAAFLLALASARRVSDFPAEIVLLVDGEEELGSPHLPRYVRPARQPRGPGRLRPGPDRRQAGLSRLATLGCKGIVVLPTCSEAMPRPGGRALPT